jgi:PAS domain S-box-containing protein
MLLKAKTKALFIKGLGSVPRKPSLSSYFSLLPPLLLTITMFCAGLAHGAVNAATDTPEVRVGSELEFPPYAFVDESGRPAGFSVDLIKAVSEVMGLSIKISTGSWDTVWNDLVAGRLDVLPIVAKSPERQRLVDFSLPHTETYDAFFVRQGNPQIQNLEAARGKQIVVMRSDAAHHALLERNFQDRLILVETIPAGLSLIASGKHDAFLCSKLIGTMVIKEHGLTNLEAGPPIPDYKRVFSFAVKKGDVELLEKLNQGLLIIKTNREYDQIYEKWLTADDPWRKLEKYLWPAIFIVIAIALIAGFWLVMLQLLVKKRTRQLSESNEMLHLAQEGLEERVAQRTAELANANVALQSEITERKLAEKGLRESEARFRSLFENMTEGVALHEMLCDDQGRAVDYRIVSTNPGFEKHTGLKPEQIQGQLASIAYGTGAAPYLEEYAQVAQTGQAYAFEIFFPPMQRHFRISVTSPKQGQFVTVFEDVTERRQAEEALQRLNAELEFSNREMEAFSYSVSHDLKAPIRAIQGFSRMLAGKHASQLDKEGLRLLEVIVNNTQIMSNLIDDLLALSRLGRQQIRKSSIDLAAMARQVFEQLQEQEQEKDLRLTIQDLPKAWGDYSLINQVMMNLLGNAIKFIKAKERAIIEVGGYIQGQETIYYVKDNGIGFDERYADKLFGVFQRLHRGPEYEGTGVGLSIVQRIIQRHGGRVWAEGMVGEGATFYFALPKNDD